MDKKRTIKTPGTNVSRVSVACDRCRKKKIRCFYEENDGEVCANCKVVGLECIFTDKLARKAFPRGYTESLEERVRMLEHENKRLQKMIGGGGGGGGREEEGEEVDDCKLNIENVLKLGTPHTHNEDCNCGMHDNEDNKIVMNHRPVSIAGSVDIDNGELSEDEDEDEGSLLSIGGKYEDDFPFRNEHMDMMNNGGNHMFYYNPNSFEQVNAPGAFAAVNLQRKLQRKNFLNLANLIAAAVPRSTEETLYLPTLLAKIIEKYGFNSRAPYLTARTIALLKQAYNEEQRYKIYSVKFRHIDFNESKGEESISFFEQLNLPNKANLDVCIKVYFNTWNNIIPIINKDKFMKEYEDFCKSRENGFIDGRMIGNERFGEILIIIVCLVVSCEGDKNSSEIINYYDHIIKEMIKSNLNFTCCITSLQLIIMELIYCLSSDDLSTSYSLRGKMVSMCQQLRLHRCPAAVLGSKGGKVSREQQGERRIIFWCIYTVDVFAGVVLGVPRLLKDSEIECALPSSEDELRKVPISFNNNNTILSLVGTVSKEALNMMRFSQVLGSIIDAIFKRSDGEGEVGDRTIRARRRCLILNNNLEEWRERANINIKIEENDNDNNNSTDNDNGSEGIVTMKYLYYMAKGLIYMPLLGVSGSKAGNYLQEATRCILRIWLIGARRGFVMALPLNAGKAAARQVLLTVGGEGSVDDGSLVLSVVSELERRNREARLGCLSDACIGVLREAVEVMLGVSKTSTGAVAPVTAAAAATATATAATAPATATAATAPTTIPAIPAISTPPAAVPPLPSAALNDIFTGEAELGGLGGMGGLNSLNSLQDLGLDEAFLVASPRPHDSALVAGDFAGGFAGEGDFSGDFSGDFAIDASLGLPFLELSEPDAKRQRVAGGGGVGGVGPGGPGVGPGGVPVPLSFEFRPGGES